jgi:hypothetical protein
MHCIIAGGEVDEKTFQKWSWIFVGTVAALHFEVIRDYGEMMFLNQIRLTIAFYLHYRLFGRTASAMMPAMSA